jgi:hypothetical protein
MPGFIDTVAVTYECSSFRGEALEQWGHRVVEKTHLARGGAVVKQAPGIARLEFSVPQRLRGSNHVLATADELFAVMTPAVEEAMDVAPSVTGELPEQLDLVRLDLARNFPIDDGIEESILDALERVATTRTQFVQRNRHGSGAGWLLTGPRSRRVVAYVRRPDDSCRRTLRLEARARKSVLRGAFAHKRGLDMTFVADVDDDKAERLGRELVGRIGWTGVLTTAGGLAAQIRAAALSPQSEAQLWALLTLPGYGRRVHSDTRAKYQCLADNLGLVPAVVPSDGCGFQLCWSTGSVVLS